MVLIFPAQCGKSRACLRPGGTLAYSIIHPCFAETRGWDWIKDDSGRVVKFTVADYFNSEPFVEYWKFGHAPNAVQVDSLAVPRFDRTLADYINSTISAGLRLDEIREPRAPQSGVRIV